MTDELKRKRHELAIEYADASIAMAGGSLLNWSDKTVSYKAGFDACHDIMKQEIEKLREQLKVAKDAFSAIVSAKESGCVEYKGCECWHQYARQAIAKIDKILEGK